jgi:hypothetical protein
VRKCQLLPALRTHFAHHRILPKCLQRNFRYARSVKPSVPDDLVWYRGKSIGLELKSRRGQCSRSQRAVRKAMLRAGVQWWVCRSAHAAMWALRKSGVRFRTLTRAGGTTERWRQPRLAPWEVPSRDLAEPQAGRGGAATRRTEAVAIACPCCSAGGGHVARRRAGAFRVYIDGMMPDCMREIRETMYLSG